MTDKTTETPNTGRELDRLAQPLARALGTIRTTLAGWDDPTIWNALAALHGEGGALRDYPGDLGDADLIQADRILCDALDRAKAERMARNAPWLAVDIRCDRGRWTLCAWHDQGEAMRREYASFAEAKAAGETLHAFLTLEGRDNEMSWETPQGIDRLPADLDPIPF